MDKATKERLFMRNTAERTVILQVQLKTYLLRRDVGFVIVFTISWLEKELECVAGFPSMLVVVGCVIANDGIAHGSIGFEMAVNELQTSNGWFGGSCSIQIVDEEERCAECIFFRRRDGWLRQCLDEFVEWHNYGDRNMKKDHEK